VPIAGASRPTEGGEGHRHESVLDGSKQARAKPSETYAARRWLLWLAGSLAVIVIGVAAALFFVGGPRQPSAELTQKRLTFNSGGNAVMGGAISPDGNYLAYSDLAGIHICLLSLSGGSDSEITVKGWPNIVGLNWLPDGKGFYVGSVSPQRTILNVDLKGNAEVLWQHKGIGLGDPIWGIPSPDGRHLAIEASASNSNVWMFEGF
jgi:hypothetical protein